MAPRGALRTSVALAMASAIFGAACGSAPSSFETDGRDAGALDAAPFDAALDSPATYAPPVGTGATTVGDGGAASTASPLDTCLEGCERTTPMGVTKLRAVFACAALLCNDACVGFVPQTVGDAGVDGEAPPVCGAVGTGPGKFTWYDEGCDACLVASCCPSITACVGDGDCDALNQCQDHCYDAGD